MKNTSKNLQKIKSLLPNEQKITLVGGCFDLLHVGHVRLLKHASSFEDILVVAVLSDQYIKGYKGVNRPIIKQSDRLEIIKNLKSVDFVYLADTSPSSKETLKLLSPESVVFGENPDDSDKLKKRMSLIKKYSPNTRIHIVPRFHSKEVSTSYIIDKIRNLED